MNYIIQLEVLCILFSLTILVGSALSVPVTKSSTRDYYICIIMNILALGFDASGYYGQQHGMSDGFITVGFFVSFIFGYIMPAVMFSFLAHFLQEKNGHNYHSWVQVMWILSLVYVAAVIYVYYNGQLFTVKNGYFITEELYFYSMYSNVSQLLYIILFIAVNAKKMGMKELVSATFYLVVPMTAAIVAFEVDEVALSFVASTLAMQMFYITTHSRNYMESQGRVLSLGKETITDSLTGLFNRRGYDAFCDKYPIAYRTGVFFFDINGLKFTNDHYGHGAGDALLTEFAELLGKCFDLKYVYRISGDEFIALLCGVDMEQYEAVKDYTYRKIQERSVPLASMGSCYADEANLLKCVTIAEDEMYVDKKEFYNKYPELIRR